MLTSGADVLIVALVAAMLMFSLFLWSTRKTHAKKLIPRGKQEPKWIHSMPSDATLAATYVENKNIEIIDRATGGK